MKKLMIVGVCFIFMSTWAQNASSSLSLQAGNVMPSSDFSQFINNGISGDIGFTKQVHNSLSIMLSAGFEQMKAIGSNEKWQQFDLNIGPVYRLTDSKIKTDVFGQIGYARQSNPQMDMTYPNSNVLVQKISGDSRNLLQGAVGVKIGYTISPRVNIYIKPQYTTGFSKISYQTRDVSPAVKRGVLDVEAANSIPFQRQSFNTSNGSINVGIDINFANDWNSTRSNKTSKTS